MTASFFILAFICLAAAVMVVVSRKLIHSALYLIVTLLAVAGIFIMLGAEFLAAVQVLVYAGSIVVLFVFVVMTVGFGRASELERTPAWWALGASLALIISGQLCLALYSMKGAAVDAPAAGGAGRLTVEMGRLIFTDWLLPLEVLSLLMLAVMVGIAALRREGRRKK